MGSYNEFGHTYSGVDITLMSYFTNEISTNTDIINSIVACGDVQTISISTHADRGIVRRIGHRGFVGYTSGPRTVAGTMIFTILGGSPLDKLVKSVAKENKYFKFDQLPPMNFVLLLENEYMVGVDNKVDNTAGLASFIGGTIFSDTGVVYSVEDIKTEMTATFMSNVYHPLMPQNKLANNTQLEDIDDNNDIFEVVRFLTNG